MSNAIQAAMTFAISCDGRIAHVDDVPNGAQCGCSCPHCGKPLIAKNGGHERAHHFAHDGTTECEGCAETAIHAAAKQILADYKLVKLPNALGRQDAEEGQVTELNDVKLEHALHNPLTQERIVADCYANCDLGPLIIEVAVHHLVDSAKAKKVHELGIPAMEIRLSDQIDMAWTWDDLENAVIFDASRRQWIYALQKPTEVTPVETPPSVPVSGLQEWRFAVGATWIWVKELPFGNVKVFHRFDEQARQIVEPICRSRGYWNGQYNNWIVFDQFKSEVLELLSARTRGL